MVLVRRKFWIGSRINSGILMNSKLPFQRHTDDVWVTNQPSPAHRWLHSMITLKCSEIVGMVFHR